MTQQYYRAVQQLTGEAEKEAAAVRGPRWEIALLKLRDLRAWVDATWPAEPKTGRAGPEAGEPAPEATEADESTPRTGRQPDWDWPRIVAQVAIAFALDATHDAGEALTAAVQDAAEHTNHRRPSRSSAQRFAKLIREAWEAHARNAKK